jgi:signal transduction histidine kinase
LRHGEAINCKHAFETVNGCGTTEYCRTCGAIIAILDGLNNKSAVQECRVILGSTQKALDLRVWATPLKINDETFTVLAVKDVQDEKRRLVLERIFFHDILNTASGLRGISELMQDSEPDEYNEYKIILNSLTQKLINELKAQRELIFAENDELGVDIIKFNSLSLLQETTDSFLEMQLRTNKKIVLEVNSADKDISSDKVLLGRVIVNMVKNALEASGSNQIIKIGCRVEGSNIEFWVNNQGTINREIQLQIFQRSFSTKGSGRGIGTYSMKLLAEQYLQGKVWFISNEAEGTTFFV